MITHIAIAPGMLRWAGDRSGKTRESLIKAFPRLSEWEAATAQPTFAQLEAFAKATYTPLGYFFLPSPPELPLPIPDLRTVGSEPLSDPGPNLLDTISICMDRQDWYRSFLIEQGEEPLDFVGSISIEQPVSEAASIIRESLSFSVEDRARTGSWEEALRLLVFKAENTGILVMISGIVGSDTHRKLDPNEFRGFALADDYAPVVFINGADARNAQIFTLVHELVHIWLGFSALTNGLLQQEVETPRYSNETEHWVNAVAAELLVPADVLTEVFRPDENLIEEVRRLSRFFKISTIVVLRRLVDLDLISWQLYRTAMAHSTPHTEEKQSSGGNFYNTAPVRASRRFTQAVISSTLEGRTFYRDAFRLLGFSSQKAFDGLRHELGLG